MLETLARLSEVLAIAFIFGGLFGLAMRPGSVALDAGLIATGILLYIASVRLALARERIEKRSALEKAGHGETSD